MKLGLSNTVRSQVSGEEWTPNDLSDLLHWYKYDTGISTFFVAGASNHIVTQWEDQKGSNHLVDTATPSNTSGYNTTHPKQDQTTKEIVFDHGADQLDLTSHISLGEFAIYLRLQFDNDTFGDILFEDTAGNNFLKVQAADELRIKISGNRHDFPVETDLVVDTPYVIGYERTDTPATTDDRIAIYVNNTLLTHSGTGDGTEAITNTLDLEQMGDPTNTVRIKEIVICNKALSSSDRTNLTNYLTAL